MNFHVYLNGRREFAEDADFVINCPELSSKDFWNMVNNVSPCTTLEKELGGGCIVVYWSD